MNSDQGASAKTPVDARQGGEWTPRVVIGVVSLMSLVILACVTLVFWISFVQG